MAAQKLMAGLEFPHWREVNVAPGLGVRMKRVLPTYTVREDAGGFVAAAKLVAQREREAALQELEKQVGMPLGTGASRRGRYTAADAPATGTRGDPLTQAYLATLKALPLTKWPAFVRTVWPSERDQAHAAKA